MGQSPDGLNSPALLELTGEPPVESSAIREEIEQTRTEMDETVQAIRDRLSSRRLIENTLDGVKDMLRNDSDKILDSLRANPIPVALISLGVGWLLVSHSDRARSAAEHLGEGISNGGARLRARMSSAGSSALDAMGMGPHASADLDLDDEFGGTMGSAAYDELEEAYDGVMECGAGIASSIGAGASAAEGKLRRAAHRVGDAASSVTHTAADRAHEMREAAARKARAASKRTREATHRLSEEARRQAQRGSETLRDTWQRNPLATGAVALALGAAVGLLLPHSQVEDEHIGPHRDDLLERAKARGEEAVDRLKGVAQRTAQVAREDLRQQVDELADELLPDAVGGEQPEAHKAEQASAAVGNTPAKMADRAALRIPKVP